MVAARWWRTAGAVLVVALLASLAGAARMPASAQSGGLWSSMTEAIGLAPPRRRPAVADLAPFMQALPEPAGGGVALAAHAGSEGHWTFLNRRGDTFTVGTPAEMARVVGALAPQAAPKAPLSIYLSADTVFERAAQLAELPAPAGRHVVLAPRLSYPLVRAGLPGSQTLRAVLRPRLHLEITSRAAFDEALRQLERPLDRPRLRLLALTPGGPDYISRNVRPDPATGRPPPDVVDPAKLGDALSALAGQKAVISGRIADKHLSFRPATGPELTLPHADLVAAVARHGVDLMIVQSVTPYQPGARTWLWQRFEIDGLGKALARATLADVLETLAGAREAVLVTLTANGPDRVVMRAGPPHAFVPGIGDGIGGMWREVATSLTGSVAPTSIELHLTSADRRRELGLRLLPIVPSSLQMAYAIALGIGLLGLPWAWRWWSRLWPAEARTEYAGAGGYWAAVVARITTFVMVFLPLVGLPAFVMMLLEWPRRVLATLGGRTTPAAQDKPPLTAG